MQDWIKAIEEDRMVDAVAGIRKRYATTPGSVGLKDSYALAKDIKTLLDELRPNVVNDIPIESMSENTVFGLIEASLTELSRQRNMGTLLRMSPTAVAQHLSKVLPTRGKADGNSN